MAELSPAAQAVLIAFRMAPSDRDEPCVAAALRALADQPIVWMNKDYILAIAAELEAER